MRILIVDDDNDSRLLLMQILEKLGHEVISAVNGAEAWDVLEREEVSFIISDWVMPRMDGLELCRRIRAARFPRYIYVILLIARDNKNELIEGMKAGADDFLVKPFNVGELNVRIKAGERVLRLERDLEERNKKLIQAYSKISNDLDAAAKMQRSLLPQSAVTLSGLSFNWIFCPCSFVAGDVFSFFELDGHHIGFYLLDVAGHGVTAAMLSVTLNKVLSSMTNQDSVSRPFMPNSPNYCTSSPAILIHELNQRFQSEDAMQYFTMVYGIIDTRDGKTKLVQAGHPSPIYQQRDGKAFLIGTGGFPVGMFRDVEYEEQEFYFHQGDRLFLYSDGITACTNREMEQFSTERLMKLIQGWRAIPLKELMNGIEQRLRLWRMDDDFDDDITLLAIERV